MTRRMLMLSVFAVALLSGCGGAGGRSGGRVVMTVRWPDRSRLIPLASNSIKAVLTRGAQVLGTQILVRPFNSNTSSVAFDNVKTGSLNLSATAFPTANATGVAQSTGVVAVDVQNGQTSNVTVTMDSTIDHLELSPANPVVGLTNPLQLTATAKDISGSIVLTTASKITWQSSDTSIATVSGSGLLTGVSPGNITITVTETESGKSLQANATVKGSTITFDGPFNFDVNSPGQLTAADLDGDGFQDIAVADGLGNAALLFGHGDGTFDPAVTFFVGTGLSDIIAADVDGDGKPDIVVCHADGDRIAVLRNLGGRNFATPVYYAVGAKPYGVTAGDFNKDGKLDLAVSNDNSNDMCVLINNGNGTFKSAVFYPGGSFPAHIKAVDLNGDGKLDLAMSNYTPGTVSIYIGQGNGTFVAGASYSVGDYPAQIIAGDFNKDGKMDLATANTFSNNVSILFGDGTGHFVVSNPYPANGYPHMMQPVDLDGDGWLDLAMPNNGTNYWTILRNKGAGIFSAPQTITSGGDNTRTMAVADFNGDGKPDIVVGNENTSNVSVFLNTTQ